MLGKGFARPFEVKPLPLLDPVTQKAEIICFWFQTVKNDWVWGKVFESVITILNILAIL